MRTSIWMSGIAALALSGFVSCAVNRSDQQAEPIISAENPSDEQDASVRTNSGGEIVASAQTPASPAALEPLPTDNGDPVDQPSPAEQPAGASPQDPAGGSEACPSGMSLVEGDFCPEPEHKCIDWMEDPVKFPYARCRAFAEPAECKTARVTMRYCIDRLEAGDDSGTPIGDVSWTQAKAACESSGKRLCQEQEWLFACEGEALRPYPYGFVRNPAICNFEKTEGLVTSKGELADHRQPVTANPECLSPFGVQNMVGNIDEWVVLDKPHYSQKNGGRRMMSGLKGGWWGPLRNRCRPTTVDHDEIFHELQTGYRCCANAQ